MLTLIDVSLSAREQTSVKNKSDLTERWTHTPQEEQEQDWQEPEQLLAQAEQELDRSMVSLVHVLKGNSKRRSLRTTIHVW